MNLTRSLLLVLVTASGACSAPHDERAASSADAILGGAGDTDVDPNTRAVGYLTSTDWNGITCSGELVDIPGAPAAFANRVFLTAAHCIVGMRHDNPGIMTRLAVGFGVRYDPNALIKVSAVIDNPGFLITGDFGDDVAVLILEQPVTDRLALTVDTSSDFRGDYTTVGYGYDKDPGGILGTKRRLDSTFTEDRLGAPLDDRFGTPTHVIVATAVVLGGESSGAVCGGDSGGALLRRGTRSLVGITSYRTNTGSCAKGVAGGYVNVAPHLPWLRQVLAACADGARDFEPQTGIFVCGKLKNAWRDPVTHDLIGLPITSAQYARNGDGTDDSYLFQWFERTRVEVHPSASPDFQIQYGRLGAQITHLDGDPRPLETPSGCSWIAKADGRGGMVCGALLAAWTAQGGMRMLGAPIAPQRAFYEKTNLYTFDGTAQWFERGRLELHPENKPPFNVLGGKLGCHAAKLDGPLGSLGTDAAGNPKFTLGCATLIAMSN